MEAGNDRSLATKDVPKSRRRAKSDSTPWPQSLLASVIENSSDAIITKDLHGTITSWNPGAERLFGYAAEKVIGKAVTIGLLRWRGLMNSFFPIWGRSGMARPPQLLPL